MKKQMKRTVYEAPVTELFRVELEGAFCASVVKETPQSDVAVTGHEENIIDGSQWDSTEWE